MRVSILQARILGPSKYSIIVNFVICNMSHFVYTDHHLKKLKSCHPSQCLLKNRYTHPSLRKESLILHFSVIEHSVTSSTDRLPVFMRFHKWLSLAVHTSSWNLLVTRVEVHILLGIFQCYSKLTSCSFSTQSTTLASAWS